MDIVNVVLGTVAVTIAVSSAYWVAAYRHNVKVDKAETLEFLISWQRKTPYLMHSDPENRHRVLSAEFMTLHHVEVGESLDWDEYIHWLEYELEVAQSVTGMVY